MDLACPKCGQSLPAEAEFCGACGARLDTSGDPLIGQTINGAYLIRKQLGAGAMGRVYLAEQLSLKKTVAVKVLHRSLCEDLNAKKRFKREALSASRLSHPNSITVIEFGESQTGDLFMVTEYISGASLAEVIEQSRQIEPARLARILIQICEALVEAHEQGVIHRDVKPENIMLVPQLVGHDLVMVLDFGIAQMLAAGPDEPRLTRAGLVCGTPEYMSPEQARRYDLDPRTDIYSLGVVMYEGLTGRLPFAAGSALDTVSMHLTELPKPPSERRPDLAIPEVMEQICLRALQKRRDDRFGSALEMQQELEQALEDIEAGAAQPVRRTDAQGGGFARPEAVTARQAVRQPGDPSRRDTEQDQQFTERETRLQQEMVDLDTALDLARRETELGTATPAQALAAANPIPQRRDPSRIDGMSKSEMASLQPNLATQEMSGVPRPRSDPVHPAARPVSSHPSGRSSGAEPFDMTRPQDDHLVLDTAELHRRRIATARTQATPPFRQRNIGRGASFPMLGLVVATLVGLAAVLLHTALFGDADGSLFGGDSTAKGESPLSEDARAFQLSQQKAIQFVSQERNADALKVLLQMRQRWPRHADVHSQVGDCYAALGDHQRAIEAYRYYLALEPSGIHAERIVFFLRKYGVDPEAD